MSKSWRSRSSKCKMPIWLLLPSWYERISNYEPSFIDWNPRIMPSKVFPCSHTNHKRRLLCIHLHLAPLPIRPTRIPLIPTSLLSYRKHPISSHYYSLRTCQIHHRPCPPFSTQPRRPWIKWWCWPPVQCSNIPCRLLYQLPSKAHLLHHLQSQYLKKCPPSNTNRRLLHHLPTTSHWNIPSRLVRPLHWDPTEVPVAPPPPPQSTIDQNP